MFGSSGTYKLEPAFDEPYQAWKKQPGPQTAGAMLRSLQPVIDRGIQAHVGKAAGPTMRSHARKLTLQALQTYDPAKARMATHITNSLQGLKRIHRRNTQVLKLPERISLDRARLGEASAELEDRLGRAPSTAELADHTGVSMKRIQYVRQFRMPLAEGQFQTRMDAGGEAWGFQPAVQQDPSQAWIDLIYQDLSPTNQKVLEYSLGLYGQPQLPNHEIARRLGVSPGAVSQRKLQIQQLIDREQQLSPFH